MFKSLSTVTIIPSLFFAITACGGNQGTQPHDMSQVQHEQAAQQEEQAAGGHADQHDPGATEVTKECGGRGACWTSRSNPTAQHKEDAEKHRELAAQHRAASAALAQAEASACVGIDDEDRDMSPFYHREDISSVKPLEVYGPGSGKQRTIKTTGATIVFRAVPGLTAEWLQREVDCHIARASSMGHNMTEMSYCPLMLKGVTAKVSSAGNGFAVEVSSDDSATAKEILRRAQALGATAQ
jgi:hypothetical protein